MKKVISLSAVVMLSFVAFAQDTLPKGHSNANPNNNLDTMTRHNNRLPKDTATKNWNNPQHTDTTNNSTTSNTMSSDSMNTSNSASGNTTTGTMTHDSSSMSNSNHNMDNGKNTGTTNSSTTTTTSSSTTNTADSIKAYEKTLTDRVMMKDDKMYMLKDGEATILEKSYKLSSGAVVSTLGTVKYPGGKVLTLKNGQFIEIKPATTATEIGAKKVIKSKKSTKSVIYKKSVKTQSN